MFSSLLVAVTLRSGVSEPLAGRRYVALPGTPEMRDSYGRVRNPLTVMWHELTLVRRDRKKSWHFLLEGKTPLHTKAADPFRRDALRPVVETPELRHVRNLYEGRQVWCYGRFTLERVMPRSQVSEGDDVAPGKPLRIARVYQLAKVPVSIHKYFISFNGIELPGSIEVQDLRDQDAFLFVYELSKRDRQLWSNRHVASRSSKDVQAYGMPCTLFLGSWYLDRVFSLVPPPSSVKIALRKANDAAERFAALEDCMKGFSQLEVAWYLGWPIAAEVRTGPIMYDEPLSKTLKRQHWLYDKDIEVRFKDDRVVWVYQTQSGGG